ncbi:MAG: NAD(P)/FAD-dependent oxidoreductase [Lentisphaeria bacterium]|jgi:phytoene dehydrogenase-like protein
MDYDVIIIGAGMAGLAAGVRLAHFGKKTLVCERHALVGGLNSYYRRHGIEFDVGLHAMTNYAEPKQRSAALNRLLRQLRLDVRDLDLQPQRFSLIRFPQETLRFSNGIAELEDSIARTFPGEIEGFRKLVARIQKEDVFGWSASDLSARQVIGEYLHDPLLTDMLLCPVMYYGNAAQGDMDFTQFCVMFISIFLEGMARPAGGIRPLLNLLLDRFKESGGELRMKCEVCAIRSRPGGGKEVELGDGSVLTAQSVISTAGAVETLAMFDPPPPLEAAHPEGQLAFVETILVLDRPVADLGFEASILFLNEADTFRFQRPTSHVDGRSAVFCAPGNFGGAAYQPGQETLRITQLADYEPWMRMDTEDYLAAKAAVLESQLALAERFAPGIRDHVVCTDIFTPRTVKRFTGHINGAVYGSPHKIKDGRLPVEGVYLCGTDQGFLGIVGAMLSGTAIVNQYLLK